MGSTKKLIQITLQVFRIYMGFAPGLTVGILITQIILTLQTLANAYVFALILDKLIGFVQRGHVTTAELLPVVFLFAFLSFVISVTGGLNDYFSDLLANFDQPKLRLMQSDFMLKLGMAQMEDPELTNKVARYNEVYGQINQHLSISIGLVATLVSVVLSGMVIFSFQPILIFLFIALFAFKFANNTRFRNKIWGLSRDNTEASRNAWSSVGTMAEPVYIKELLISGGAVFLRKKFTDFVDSYFAKFTRLRTRWSIFEMIQAVFDGLLFAFGIFIVMQKGIEGAITVGAITFYIRSLSTFSDQIDSLSYRIGRVAASSIRIQDALELFELYKPEIDGTIVLLKSSKPPLIDLNDITFMYPNGIAPVLENLFLKIKPGEKIAIVGENGAGKTTLVKIITKIYHPQGGEVLVDGIDLRKVRAKSWYHKLGVLFQDFNTYGHLTAEENIGIGRIVKGSFKKEKVIEALKKADALDLVEKYPNKLNQILSERFKGGIRPSGGQWQKIAIARFFYRNAPVLILDEPTASIDAIAESHIFDNIYKFMKGKTVIIISHRFSTVRNADRIIVLDKGKIIEDGSHEELLTKGGKYAKSFKLQAKGYK